MEKANNIALYRKYRPEKFDDVIGQDSLVKTLQKAIKSGSPSHAYIFAGTRGVGKTTIARIFAKELQVQDKDIYELDAASNNSVEDIRDLRESVATLPFESKYKVYILDEAHMLSRSAFNAFLKTLEEPPEYCIFILATTEPDKLPDTIRSRAQLFTLRSPNTNDLTKVLNKIAKAEGYTLDSGADNLIAMVANGSFRDGISALQKVLAMSQDNLITTEDVGTALGVPKLEFIHNIINALNNADLESFLSVTEQIRNEDINVELLLAMLLERIRTVILLKYANKEFKESLKDNYNNMEIKFMLDVAGNENTNITSKVLSALLRAQDQLRFASIKVVPLEIAGMELCGK